MEKTQHGRAGLDGQRPEAPRGDLDPCVRAILQLRTDAWDRNRAALIVDTAQAEPKKPDSAGSRRADVALLTGRLVEDRAQPSLVVRGRGDEVRAKARLPFLVEAE